MNLVTGTVYEVAMKYHGVRFLCSKAINKLPTNSWFMQLYSLQIHKKLYLQSIASAKPRFQAADTIK